MRTYKILLALFILPFMFTACDEFNNESDSAKIRFLLTDAPGNFQEVNIDVQAIQVIIDDSIYDLETNQGIYNLLEFVNGEDTILVTDEVPSGMLSQIRLILGENNSIMVDSAVYDIKTPSAQQSGLKLQVHEDISGGVVYTYVIDFDAARSIVKTGNGKFILKPVIRVFTEAITGSIEGVVQPAEARPTVLAIGPADDTTSVFTDTLSGQFMIRGLATGLYDLEFHPDTAYDGITLVDVEVFAGQSTVLDTIWFE
jgi:hypothetical protein